MLVSHIPTVICGNQGVLRMTFVILVMVLIHTSSAYLMRRESISDQIPRYFALREIRYQLTVNVGGWVEADIELGSHPDLDIYWILLAYDGQSAKNERYMITMPDITHTEMRHQSDDRSFVTSRLELPKITMVNTTDGQPVSLAIIISHMNFIQLEYEFSAHIGAPEMISPESPIPVSFPKGPHRYTGNKTPQSFLFETLTKSSPSVSLSRGYEDDLDNDMYGITYMKPSESDKLTMDDQNVLRRCNLSIVPDKKPVMYIIHNLLSFDGGYTRLLYLFLVLPQDRYSLFTRNHLNAETCRGEKRRMRDGLVEAPTGYADCIRCGGSSPDGVVSVGISPDWASTGDAQVVEIVPYDEIVLYEHVFFNMSKQYEGVYTCYATFGDGSRMSKDVWLNVGGVHV